MTENENANQDAVTTQRYSPFALAALCCFGFAMLFPLLMLMLVGFRVPLLLTISFCGFAELASGILATIALIQILRKRHLYKGLLPAGIIFGINLCFLVSFIARDYGYRDACASNLSGLGKSLQMYAATHHDKLPVASKWCDLLVTYADTSTGQFCCLAYEPCHGESAYALNKFVADANLTQLPPNVVLVFETDLGRDPNNKATNRQIDFIDDANNNPVLIRSASLDKLRWNQFGGPEILTASHHRGKGANILFADGHVEFVPVEKFPTLRWKP
jgi:prepilin-type processing-associated H-X9-DG protein